MMLWRKKIQKNKKSRKKEIQRKKTAKIRMLGVVLLLTGVLWADTWNVYGMVQTEVQERSAGAEVKQKAGVKSDEMRGNKNETDEKDEEGDEKDEIKGNESETDEKDGEENETDEIEGDRSETDERDGEGNEADEIEGDGSEDEEGNGSETEEDETGQDKPENDEIGESFTEPEILFPEADGKQGFYVTCPEIKIIHTEKRAVTKYELLSADGKKQCGKLEVSPEVPGQEVVIQKELTDGENVLKVWMEKRTEETSLTEENKDDSVSGETEDHVFEKEFRFRLDTTMPENVKFSYNCVNDGSILFFREQVKVSVKCEDAGSGIEYIYYNTSGGEEGVICGNSGNIFLNPGFSGHVQAFAVDKAGNQGKTEISKMILCENNSPEIQIRIEDENIVWHQKPVQIHVSVSDAPLSSGIRSLKCYYNGQVVVQKSGEMDGKAITSMEAGFTADIMSKCGEGVPIVVEVQDRAGNIKTDSRMIYLDRTAPEIQMEGVHDGMITGQPVMSDIKIREENLLSHKKIEIWKTAPDGNKELIEQRSDDAGENDGIREEDWSFLLEEDGIYNICVWAEDAAGNKAEAAYQVTVDKTNPIINYVEQMQGIYVPYFQWNYGAEEMIQDFTEYTYEILLDGLFYAPGLTVRKEGTRFLQVKAVDAAGNRASAEAVFQIDHTPPDIHIYDIEDGSTYRQNAVMSVSVEGQDEFLRQVIVNKEKMRLDANSQIFQQEFEETGNYHVEILAEDLAGNQSEKSISFCIEEQHAAEKLLKPVMKVINRNPVEKAEEENRDQKGEMVNWRIVFLILLLVVILFFSFKMLSRSSCIWKNDTKKHF